LLSHFTSIRLPRFTIIILLLFVSVAGYFLFITRLGYYWDDWAFIWIAKQLGTAGLQRYFATNRVFWGYIYQLSARLLGAEPWQWQVYGLLWRWLCALSLWWFLRQLWRETPRAADWVSILFAVYPGFSQQPIAILSSHFFIVLSSFFLSLGVMLVALRSSGRRKWLFTALSLILAAVNFMTLEYFFLLDLLRPLFIYVAVGEIASNRRSRLKHTLAAWLPYMAFFILMAVWRAFFFSARPENFQTDSYSMVLLQGLKSSPAATLAKLGSTVLHDLWLTTGAAWAQALIPPLSSEGPRTLALYAALVIFTLILLLAFFFLVRSREKQDGRKLFQGWGWQALCIGVISLLPAGVPFWLTDLPIGLTFPNDRFTLPFMLGASLLVAGLVEVLPIKHAHRIILFSLLVSLAVGWHLQVANAYRRDWERQRALFWQMSWRIPALEVGTTLLANDWEPRFYSDNSLTAPLNWIYDPDNHSDRLSYMFYFPSVRLGYGLKGLEKGLPIQQNYLAGTFYGSTSQAVGIYYGADACLRVLDPLLDADHYALEPEMRRAALISTTVPIFPAQNGESFTPPDRIFGEEPAHSWCYFFEKADLARQQGDWQEIVRLGEQAFSAGDNPNDPLERTPFIEGYAHTGNWDSAEELTLESWRVTPLVRWPLCRLWQRIDEQVPASPEKQAALQSVNTQLECK
jgi:hypothetical protein